METASEEAETEQGGRLPLKQKHKQRGSDWCVTTVPHGILSARQVALDFYFGFSADDK